MSEDKEKKKEQKPKTKTKIENLDLEKLKEVARGIVYHEIFCDRHIPPNDTTSLPMVFMPLALGALQDVDIETVGMIYERLDKAGPGIINGLPYFFSMGILNRHDTEIVANMVRSMTKAMEESVVKACQKQEEEGKSE